MLPNDHERRIVDLEAQVAILREQLDRLTVGTPWWDSIAGSFAGDPIYVEAMKLGREYRNSQVPSSSRKSQP
jgi:hypothetical protein